MPFLLDYCFTTAFRLPPSAYHPLLPIHFLVSFFLSPPFSDFSPAVFLPHLFHLQPRASHAASLFHAAAFIPGPLPVWVPAMMFFRLNIHTSVNLPSRMGPWIAFSLFLLYSPGLTGTQRSNNNKPPTFSPFSLFLYLSVPHAIFDLTFLSTYRSIGL